MYPRYLPLAPKQYENMTHQSSTITSIMIDVLNTTMVYTEHSIFITVVLYQANNVGLGFYWCYYEWYDKHVPKTSFTLKWRWVAAFDRRHVSIWTYQLFNLDISGHSCFLDALLTYIKYNFLCYAILSLGPSIRVFRNTDQNYCYWPTSSRMFHP